MRRGPAARKRFSVEFGRAKIACKNGRVDRGAVSVSLQPFSFALIYLVQYHEISIKPTLCSRNGLAGVENNNFFGKHPHKLLKNADLVEKM